MTSHALFGRRNLEKAREHLPKFLTANGTLRLRECSFLSLHWGEAMTAQKHNSHRNGWFVEYSRTARDELLSNGERHEELVGLYPWSPNFNELIDERVIPGYVLIDRLDVGIGTGMVFLAITDPETFSLHSRRAVCIKIPSYDRSTAPGILAIESISNEIEILHKLDAGPMIHGIRPRLLNSGLLNVGTDQQLPYLMTEYLAFLTPFKNYSHKGEINTWIKIAQAFHELHSMGIVHGDIYENNLFFTKDDRPVILDFGSARQMGRFKLRRKRISMFLPPECPDLDEIEFPNQQLRGAFDVACLAATFRRSIRSSHKEMVSESRNGELLKLFAICIRKEPEYRPQTSGELAGHMQKITENKTFIVKPARFAVLRILNRRHPSVLWSTMAICAALFIASIFFLFQWRGEVAFSLAKERTMAKMFRATRTVLNSTIALDESEIPTQTDGKISRQNLAVDLAEIVQDSGATEADRLSALKLMIDTARGHLEVDGINSADKCLSQAKSVLPNPNFFSGSNLFVHKCLEVQLTAFQSAMTHSMLASDSNKTVAFALAKKAVDEFLAIDLKSGASTDHKHLFLETGIDVLMKSIYTFSPFEWEKSGEANAAYNVFQHAVKTFQNGELEPQLHLPLAQLNCQFALLIHKSHVPRLIQSQPAIQFAAVRRHISIARGFLKQYSDAHANFDPMLVRVVSATEASLSTIAGLSYIQSSELDIARIELGKALQYRKLQMEERPGSLRAKRDVISTAWTLSDTYFSAARANNNSVDLLMQSIPMRQFAVNQCRRLYEMSPDLETKIAFQVNQVRLSFSQILCGQVDEAILGLKTLDELASLEDPGTQHTLGDDVYICIAHLRNAFPNEPKYEELLNKQATILLDRLNDARRPNGTLRVAEIHKQITMLLSLLKSPMFSALASNESWLQIIKACERDGVPN